jgi:hypothetical protein
MAVLYYWKAYDGHEIPLHEVLGTTSEEGTDPLRMTRALKDFHLDATYLEHLSPQDLRKFIGLGYTVIVDYQAWRDASEPVGPWTESWEDGHYSVVVAMDREFLYLMDPSAPAAYGYLPIPEFVDRWHDYELRNGAPVRYFHQGIVVRGRDALPSIPAPLIRVE